MKKIDKVTIKDVAKIADVSVTTISNYLNGRFKYMSTETRQRIDRAISKTGYMPSMAGQNLRLQKQRLISIVFQRENAGLLSDPMLGQTIEGLSRELTTWGYGLIVACVGQDDISEYLAQRTRQSDCVCLMRSGESDPEFRFAQELSKASIPLVFIHQHAPEGLIDATSVRQAEFEAADELAALVLESRPSSVLLLTQHLPWPAIEARVAGFRNKLDKRPEVHVDRLTCDEFDYSSVANALESYRATKALPDVVMCGNDQIAYSVYNWAREAGLRIPDDFQLTGFNALPFQAPQTIQLTSVLSVPFDIGRRAAQAIQHRIQSGSFAVRDEVVALSLQVGSTTRSSKE